MTVLSFLNQKGGVGKTTLALHVAAALARAKTSVLLIDGDPQGSALDWAIARDGTPPFPVVGLPKRTLHQQVPIIGKHYDWVIIDGAPRVNDLAKSAIVASDLVLIPIQPSPFDVWAAKDILELLEECAIMKPTLDARFILNRVVLRTTLANEVRDALADLPCSTCNRTIRNRTAYAKAVREGRTALEIQDDKLAGADVLYLAIELVSIVLADQIDRRDVITAALQPSARSTMENAL